MVFPQLESCYSRVSYSDIAFVDKWPGRLSIGQANFLETVVWWCVPQYHQLN